MVEKLREEGSSLREVLVVSSTNAGCVADNDMGIGCNGSFWKDTLKMGGIISGGTRGSSIGTNLGYMAPHFGTNKISPEIKLGPWQTNPVGLLSGGITPNSPVLTTAARAAHQGLGVGKNIFKGAGLFF